MAFQSPLQLASFASIQDLLQRDIFLHAMSTLSSQDFDLYLTRIDSSMSALERGIHCRSLSRLEDQISSLWMTPLCQDRQMDIESAASLSGLQSLAIKSAQARKYFQIDPVSNDTNCRSLASLFAWRPHQSSTVPKSPGLTTATISYRDSIIKYKQIQGTRTHSAV